jgi:hypothetical protein
MAGISSTNLQIAIGTKPQTEYATATAVAANAYIEQVLKQPSFIKREVPTANNKGETTGQRFATESYINGRLMTSFSMSFDVTFQNIGRYLNAVCGSVTPSAAATLYRNLFKLLDTKISQQLPPYSLIEHAAPANGGLDVKATGMVAKSLKLSGDGAARCQGQMEWIGSGDYIQPSGIVWSRDVTPTQGTQVCIYNTTSKLIRSDAPGGGNAVNRSMCENLGWEISIVNSFAENDPGCVRLANPSDISKGIYASQMLLTDTEISSSWKFKLQQNSTEMTLLENNAPLKLLFGLLSTETLTALSQVLNFDMPLNKYKVVDHDARDGFIYLTIQPETLYSVASSKALEVELINDIQTYN